MKRTQLNYLILFSTLMSCLLIYSCKVEHLDEDIAQYSEWAPNNLECEVIFTGKVVNTENLKALKDVDIMINSVLVEGATKGNGQFRIQMKLSDLDLLKESTLKFSLEGFITEELKINLAECIDVIDCPLFTSLNYKVGLTPKQEPILVDENGGIFEIKETIAFRKVEEDYPPEEDYDGQYEYDDEKGNGKDEQGQVLTSMTTYFVNIPPNTFHQPTSICITPSAGFILGPGIILTPESFYCKIADIRVDIPDNLLISKPVTISFEPHVTLGPASALTNGALVNNGMVVIELLPLADVMIFNTSQSIVFTELEEWPDAQGPTDLFSNCDCGPAVEVPLKVRIFGSKDIDIDFPGDLSDFEKFKYFRDLRRFLGLSGAFKDKIKKKLTIDKCSCNGLVARFVIKKGSGKIFGLDFRVIGTVKVLTSFEEFACPTTTPCHQGCPH